MASGLVRIKYSSISIGNPIPQEVEHVISPVVWAELSSLRNDECMKANAAACAMECGACLFICLFAFLCHPCVYCATREVMVRAEIDRLNRNYYGSQPVLQLSGNELWVYTMNVPPGYVAGQTCYVVQQPGSAQMLPIQTQAQYSNEVPIANVATGQRQIKVLIPEGVVAGSTIAAVTPEGITVQVTVPPDCKPGQELTVEY